MKDKLKKYLNMTTVTIISFVLGIAGIIATYLFAKWQMRRKKIVHFALIKLIL